MGGRKIKCAARMAAVRDAGETLGVREGEAGLGGSIILITSWKLVLLSRDMGGGM